jgi:predicted TIM-barrel fold metal-dependent hydrolase
MTGQAPAAQSKTRPQAGGRRIDIHQHIILPEYERALQRAGARDASLPPREKSDPARILAYMEELGIDGAVLNPVNVLGVHHGDDANSRYLTESTNEALASFVAAAPDRLGFFAILPAPDIDGALAQLAHALDTLHADGLFLFSNQNGVYLGDPRLEPLYAELDRRRAVVFVHPALPAYVGALGIDLFPACIEYPFETTRAAANLIYTGMMGKYPHIRWILAHGGGTVPYLSYRLRLMEHDDRREPLFNTRVPEGVAPYLDRFYYDLALVAEAAPLAALDRVAHPERILYGTDIPFIGKQQLSEQQQELSRFEPWSGAPLAAVERHNAARLFSRFADRGAGRAG